MISKPEYRIELTQTRGIELALLLMALFGFWEFTLSSWPFKSGEFNDLWPFLKNSQYLSSTLFQINAFASHNSRILELIPALVAEACFISYALGQKRLFTLFGTIALILFTATLHFTNFTHGNHPYYDFLMLAVMVVAPGSLASLRVAYALTYFMCSLLKVNNGWITGSFFLTADGYLPFAPPQTVPYLTNLMIIFQMFGCFLLLSSNLKLRQFMACLILLFHFYSVIIAGSRFSWSTFPFIILLYMSARGDDTQLPGLVEYRALIKRNIYDISHALKLTSNKTAAIICTFIVMQGLAALDLISEKRTFNMFSNATACVVTLAGPSFNRQYGHPVGSNACFKEQVIYAAKEEFCSNSQDFDLRLEISENGGNFNLEHEQLSVCRDDIVAYHLPPISTPPKFQKQNVISPVRSDEKIEVALTGSNSYEFNSDYLVQQNKEFWQIAKVDDPEQSSIPDVNSTIVNIYKVLLASCWLAISCFLIGALVKNLRQ